MAGRDVNAFVQEDPLFVMPAKTDFEGWQGYGLVRYEVAKVRDVRNLGSTPAYRVRCTLRLRVLKSGEFELAHDPPKTWAGYPAALINVLQPRAAAGAPELAITLTGYTPKTVNASVSADIALIKGVDTTLTRQHTVGSATTVTNSFGANIGVGAEGEPTGGLSFEHAETSESRNEWMNAANRGSSSQLSESAGMTLKDWAAFARLGISSDGIPNVTWIWAQEYPWDAVLLRPYGSDETKIDIPADVQLRMSGDGTMQPPSHLAQMGFDFVCGATWMVKPKAWSPTVEPQLTFEHTGVFWQATHAEDDASDTLVSITPNSTPYPASGETIIHTLPLERFSLVPISVTGAGSRAMIGFTDNEIQAQDATGFAASSRMDNLYVLGKGFVYGVGYGYTVGGMALELDAGQSGTLTLFFNVLDRESEYDLALKHWITGNRPATVSVWVNPNPASDVPFVVQTPPTVRRYVTEHEGDGGDDNVTMISLRSLAFGAVDYHDYLKIGMNRIVVQVSPSQDDPDPTGAGDMYVLRALSIA